MSDIVLYRVDGNVAIIQINNPPVNALSPGVPEGIWEGLDEAQADDSVEAVVLIGGGRTFIAGADIKGFAKAREGHQRAVSLPELILHLEDSGKPVVAAIHGTAFGGGLETAMGCAYRVAIASAQVGQPEVKLGIIPGALGTQRLPRLVGVELGAEMCAFGDPIPAAKGFKAGVIDAMVDGKGFDDLLEGAIAFARDKAAAGGPHPKARERNDRLGTDEENAPIFAKLRAKANKIRRNQLAVQKAIDACEAATKLPFEEGFKREQELFRECLQNDQSKGLIHAFFGERQVRKIPDVPKDTPIREINTAAVIGGGTMGVGITMNYASAGIPVMIKEISQEAVDKAMATIRKNYERSQKRGRFTQEYVDKALSIITPTTSYDGFEKVDIIVEAVFEGMALKKQIFGEIDKIARPGCILASNTSTLDIDEIASATTRPADVIGHHFFSPANVMKLVEVVRGKESSKDVIATSMALSRRLGKIAVLVGNCRAFVGNRMFGPYRRESTFLVEEGASVGAVDKALYDFGMAMGPLATGDLAGLDVGARIRKEYGDIMFPEGSRRPMGEDALYERGRYGQKTGAGWWKYGADRSREEDPEVEALLRDLAKQAGIEQREIGEQEIIDRCVYALVNEGARILEEGYALRAVDIDIIYLYGYGFPAYRGGPMSYADTVGLDKVYARILEFHEKHGYWWKPAPLLKELAESGQTFAQWDKKRG